MATTVAVLEALLRADTRDFDRAMGRSESKMGSVAKTAGKAGLAGALVGLGAAVKVGVGEFMEAQKVTAQTNAVLKSTGGAANITTAQVQKLSEALMKKSGVDDEAIQSGQNMLLTFTKIRNETGKGNDVFNQATKATLDLSVAMGKDMQSSAVLVGKALNDPIKGIGALSRVGVQLSEDQKEMIKTMVKAGDTAGAQKVILKELETQFGGSAEAAGKTFGGQINIARERLNNFAGSMVEKAIPVLEDMFRVFRDDLLPVLVRFRDWIQDNILPVLRGWWRFIDENVIPVMQTMGEIAGEAISEIGRVLKENEPELKRILGFVKGIGDAMLWLAEKVVLPVLKPLFTKVLPVALEVTIEVLDKVIAALDAIVEAFKWIGRNVGNILGKVGDLLGKIPDLNPFGGPGERGAGLPPSRGGSPTGAGGLGLVPQILDELALGQSMGLYLSSGLRPPRYPGDDSDHIYGRAIDMAGAPGQMAAFAVAAMRSPGVKDVFYDPLGFSLDNGKFWGATIGGHADHVHVSTFDQGGILRPGWTMAYNGTGRNEYVTQGAATINLYNHGVLGSEREVVGWLKNALERDRRRG